MNIATRISELLFDYECVVLPEFGGFISNNKPARVNAMSHQFNPPYREILFNVQLSANDGLLTKYIAQQESISYKEAKHDVTEFVTWCRHELEAGRPLHFTQIGQLSYDEERNIVFEQDIQLNYNPDSFGLSNLISPAIKRVSQEEKIKGIILSAPKVKKRIDRKSERDTGQTQKKTKKAIYPFPLAIASLFLLVVVISSVFMTRQSSMISLAGLFSPTSGETSTNQSLKYQEKNAEPVVVTPVEIVLQENADEEQPSNSNHLIQVPAEKENADQLEESTLSPVGSLDETIPEIDVTQPAPTETKPDIKISIPEIQSSKKYYIIAGSFSEQVNAQKLVLQLVEKGYSAVVADTNQNGMYRVAYAGFENWSTAKHELLAIRQDENKEAWVLKK